MSLDWAWDRLRTWPPHHDAPKGSHNLAGRDHRIAGSLIHPGPDHALNQVDLVGIREQWSRELWQGNCPTHLQLCLCS